MDDIIDLVFETQQESDQKAQSIEELEEVVPAKTVPAENGPKFIPKFTPKHELEAKRQTIIESRKKWISLQP